MLGQQTGVLVAATTVSRLLAELAARRGRPRPVAPCRWPRAKRAARLAELERLAAALPRGEDGVHADEVDVHLNPKVGPDWMLPGRQKLLVTPGKNEKRHLAGALDVRTGRLAYVEGAAKTSARFVTRLWALVRGRRRGGRRLHVVLDNYGIHKSRMARQALEAFGGRVVLHFLPPYCPEGNRIERVWLDLHAAVTRNHRRRRMADLMADVHAWIEQRNRRYGPARATPPSAARPGALESCKTI